MIHSPLRLAAIAVIATAMFAIPQSASAKSARPLVVPFDHATIQGAIDAASPGGTIIVLPGTYTEQISIAKDLSITGAGMGITVVRAPAVLVPNTLGSPSIVEVYGGANVSIARLTITGPGAAACGEQGVLRWGVRVHNAHLDLGYAAVRDIHNTPAALCPQSGTAISVGQSAPGSPPASINIHHSEVTNYSSVGIIVLGAGSRAEITQNLVAGPGHGSGVPTDGIELVAGANGTIARNIITGNICPPDLPENCGPDFFTQFQHAGIGGGGNGPGTVISNNLLVGNQMGIFLSEVDEISNNVMVDNDYFGIGLVGLDSGSFTIDGATILGGGGGVWVAAVLADMTVTLDKVRFVALSGPEVEILEDGGFTATVIGWP